MINPLEERFQKLAASYVPEWRFSADTGDLGSCLAGSFLELFQDSLMRENRVRLKRQQEFVELLGVEPREAGASEGYMTFNLVKPDLPETLLPAGTEVISQDSNGDDVMFWTVSDLNVTGNTVTEVTEVDGVWKIRLLKPLSDTVYQVLMLPEETAGQERFHLVLDVRCGKGERRLELSDTTEGISHSGLLIFAGGKKLQTDPGGEEAGALLLLRDSSGRGLPKKTARLFLNAVSVRSMDTGARTNLPPGASHMLALTTGYISEIANPEALYGGSDPEREEAVGKRAAARLKHRDRAVTPRDYERLAVEACPLVQKVRCFPGYNREGKRVAGSVAVVVLLKNQREDRGHFSDGLQGDGRREESFGPSTGEMNKILEQIYRYIAGRCDGGLVRRCGLYITEPLMVLIDVKAELAVDSADHFLEVKRRAETDIALYLLPLGAGGGGIGEWSMGNLPDHERIKHLLKKADHVAAVRRLYINCRIWKEGRLTDVRFEEISHFPWCLPRNGCHEIIPVPR